MAQRVLVIIRIPTEETTFEGSELVSTLASTIATETPVEPLFDFPPGAGLVTDLDGRTRSKPDPSSKKEASIEMAELTFKSPLAMRVNILLSKMGITWSCWITSSCQRFYEIHFVYEGGFKCERLVHELDSLGVGPTPGTSITCIPISIHSSPRVTRPTSVDMQIRKHPHKTTGGQPEARASVNHPPKEVVPISGPNRATGIPGVNAGILTPKQSQRPPFSEVQGSVTHRPAGHTSISIETLEAKDSDSISPSDPCDSLIKEKRYEWPSDYEHKLSTVTHVQFDALPPAKRSKIKQFMKTIKSRLTVQEVLSVITESTKITFDYVCLCILASILSAIGLMINSSVVIVASMLISPLMGPILAIVFAIVIHDVRLLRRGIRAELWGAAICLIIGSVIGSIDALLRVRHEMPVGYPTGEMCSRGQYMGLVSGIFIALPSGAGVAISVLGGNVGSLVGVAISASLLPPAVNCGVLYGYASVVAIVFKNVGIKANMTSEDCCLLTQAKLNETVGPLGLAALAAEAGTVSLLLTLLNVVCIIYMGFIVLKIKQVAPISTFTDTFWKEDVKTAKEYYKTIEREDAVQMRNQYLTYLREMISEPEGSDPNIEDNGVMYIPDDLNDLSKNINTISKNVFRYGPHKKSIVEEVLPDFDAEPTHEHRRTSSIRLVKFSDEIDGRTKSIGDRFQVVPVPDFKVKEP